ncbi:MAG: FAD-dependent monooxygenase [Actinomycetota bacterium]|nr:FAD-dependent monooxygenase [Actinomycetota bacterium]MDP9486893.1 FAD-dependent monooxygenase [Actinomycetota bacterium]
MRRKGEVDVLVVGAGPTGLTLAYSLRRLGVSFRIVDKSPEPSTTSKAIGLQYRVSEVLAWMGLFDRFLARGVTGTGVDFYAGGERILHLSLDGLEGLSGGGAFEPRSIVIPQSVTEALLIEALGERGVEVERGTTFLGFTQDGERVVSQVRRADGVEENIEARYLVGCDGPHSVVRKGAKLPFAGKTYPVSYFMADVELDWEAARDTVHVWIHESGMFSAIPMPGERRWRLFVESGKEVEEGATEVTMPLIRRPLHPGEQPHVALGVQDQLPDGGPFRRGPGVPRGRRGPRPQPDRWPGDNDGRSGCLQPFLEARRGAARRGFRLAPGHLHGGAVARRPPRAQDDRWDRERLSRAQPGPPIVARPDRPAPAA